MRTRLRLRRATGHTDVVVTTDAGATVADVAQAITRADAATGHPAASGAVTLQVEPPDGGPARLLRPTATLADAGLRSGSTATVVPTTDAEWRATGPDAVAARLYVVAGPGAGKAVDLPRGTSTIGRGPGADVRLDDPMVSKTHARIHVSDVVEVVDAGSANGVIVGSGFVERAVLTPTDVVVLGETVVQVSGVRPPDPGGATTGSTGRTGSTRGTSGTGGAAVVAFNRSPRVVPGFPERTVEAPTPPDPVNPGRFPLVAMVAPLVLGVVLFMFWRNPFTVVFIALSPLLMVGTWLDRQLTDRRRLRTQTGEFRAAVRQLVADLEQNQVAEREARVHEAPSTADAVAAGRDLQPLLWCRRPEHTSFLAVRVGLGRATSRTSVTMPPRGTSVADLWAELREVRDRFVEIDPVPVVVDLPGSGALGIAGPREVADDVARALVAQIVCLHSPAELVLAGVASSASAPRWDWVKWLPHTGSAHSPIGGPHLAAGPAAGLGLVTRLEEVVAARRSERSRTAPLPAVVLLVEDDAQVDRGRLVRLAEEGPEVGVYVLWCADAVERLPAVCRSFVRLGGPGSDAAAGLVREGVWRQIDCERLDGDQAVELALRLSAVEDAGAPVLDESDLPRSVPFLALAGPEVATDAGAVVERWRETGSILDRAGATPAPRRHDASLRALVGQGSSGEFVLDLRSQGPHALVGGTTGSGKSEFLQAWVLGLAAAHSPDRVSFLFVDYKGGAAFADCVDLPHTVGLVTDLSGHLVRRALTSLRAELHHRERLLNRKKAKDLLALERTGDPETPPALVIVVDEFAALVGEVPEFVDGVVDVAQRGRSLGLHLVLATQRPAGVIKDNLRANTNLRVALRMADEHDSVDVLGTAVAATFDPGVPGRGAVRTGPGRVAMFQTGYVGGRSGSARAEAVVAVESLTFGPGEPWTVPPRPTPGTADDEGPTDIARAVRTMAAAAASAGVPRPRRPWLPELPDVVDLAGLGDQRDDRLVLGVCDVPARQEQRPFCYLPDRDGCLLVTGTSGSGTSTLLRTVAATAGAAVADAGCAVRVYGLDFGSGGLAMLDALPHVGAVVDGSDGERVARLVRRLRDDVEERAARYARVRAGTIGEYRTLTGETSEPRVLLLVDGLSAFREAYEAEPGRASVWSAFGRVVAEGRPLGIHVVMAGGRPGALPSSLGGSVQRRLVLRQADDAAYGVLGVPKDVLGPGSPPGRGVVAGESEELQVAVPGGRTSPAEQSVEIEALAARLRSAGAPPAPPVRRLPTLVEQAAMPDDVDGLPVLGVADDTLEPCGFDPSGTFVVAGLPGSGRTTALRSIAASLRRFRPDAGLYYVGQRRSPATGDGVWTRVAVTPEEAVGLARDLLEVLAVPPDDGGLHVLVVESVAELLGGPAEQPLTEAVRAARRGGHLVVAEAETSSWGSAWPLVAEVRNGRRGLVLQPDHMDGDALFRTAFPRMSRAEFPPGRGVYVESGRLRRVQLPVPGLGP